MGRRVIGTRQKRGVLPAVAAALDELDAVARRRPELQAPIAFHRKLLPRLFTTAPSPSPPDWPADADRRLADGVSLLRQQAVAWPDAVIADRWLDICDCFRDQPAAAAAASLALAVRRREVVPATLAADLVAAPRSANESSAAADADQSAVAVALEPLRALGLDEQLGAMLLRLSLLPLLSAWCKGVTEHFAGVGWNRGYCPFCGSWPLLSELRGLNQARYLRCGLCAADWPFDRLRCPYCACADPTQLNVLHVDGEADLHRLDTCQACHRYIKTVARIEALDAPGLLVADLATVHLDFIAAQSGLVR